MLNITLLYCSSQLSKYKYIILYSLNVILTVLVHSMIRSVYILLNLYYWALFNFKNCTWYLSIKNRTIYMDILIDFLFILQPVPTK